MSEELEYCPDRQAAQCQTNTASERASLCNLGTQQGCDRMCLGYRSNETRNTARSYERSSTWSTHLDRLDWPWRLQYALQVYCWGLNVLAGVVLEPASRNQKLRLRVTYFNNRWPTLQPRFLACVRWVFRAALNLGLTMYVIVILFISCTGACDLCEWFVSCYASGGGETVAKLNYTSWLSPRVICFEQSHHLDMQQTWD